MYDFITIVAIKNESDIEINNSPMDGIFATYSHTFDCNYLI